MQHAPHTRALGVEVSTSAPPQDMEASEIGAMLRHPAAGASVKTIVDAFPRIAMEALLQPITRTVVRVQLTITPEFRCEACVPTFQ